MPASSGDIYNVIYTTEQRQRVRVLGARAYERGLLAAYLAAVKSIDRRLKSDPLGWGDPQNNLRHLGLVLYHGTRAPLHVFYAVDSQRRLVFVRQIEPLPGAGLGDDE